MATVDSVARYAIIYQFPLLKLNISASHISQREITQAQDHFLLCEVFYDKIVLT